MDRGHRTSPLCLREAPVLIAKSGAWVGQGLKIVYEAHNQNSYTFQAKAGDVVLISASKQGLWDQVVQINLNGAVCARDHGNSHERTHGQLMSASATCVGRANDGVNHATASNISRIIVIR